MPKIPDEEAKSAMADKFAQQGEAQQPVDFPFQRVAGDRIKQGRGSGIVIHD